jgi:hypothetical protein
MCTKFENMVKKRVENLPRKNTTITTFHAVSKEGTGLFANERRGIPGGAVHMHDSEKARN